MSVPWTADWTADFPQDMWRFDDELTTLLAGSAHQPDRTAPPPDTTRHRRTSHRRHTPPAIPRPRRADRPAPLRDRLRHLTTASWLQWLSLLIVAVTAAVATAVSVLSAAVSYNPMRDLAMIGLPPTLAALWPFLIFGTWLTASLSLLRAALHQGRVKHPWVVEVIFAAVTIYLCVAHAPRTPTAIAIAGLTPLTALVSFHQLIHQITTLNRPRHRSAPRLRTNGQHRG